MAVAASITPVEVSPMAVVVATTVRAAAEVEVAAGKSSYV